MKCNYYTVAEIVKAYKLSYRTVWNWVKAGDLEAIKVRGRLRIRKASLDKLVKKE